MSSGGGGDDGRGGGISRDAVEEVGNLRSGINCGGGIELGGGGWRGGGGSTIIGGLDLSIADATLDGVRERATISSITDERADSIDCRLSEVEVRGRGMNVAFESRLETFWDCEGAAEIGNEVVVGPADGGGEINWNRGGRL